MKFNIKAIIVPSIPLAVLLITSSLLIWVLSYFYLTSIGASSPFIDITLFGRIYDFDNRIANLISLFITLFNAFLISRINNKYVILRSRSFLPPFIYILLISSWLTTHSNIFAHLALTFYLFSLFMTFSMNKNGKATEEAFLGAFFLGVASFFVKPIAFFLPLIWMGFLFFNCFSLRTFLASIIGFLTPWLLYLSIRYYIDPQMLNLDFFTQGLDIGFLLLSRPLNELIYISSMIVLILIIIIGTYTKLYSKSPEDRAKINYIFFILLFSFIISLLIENQYIIFMPFVSFGYSILISHSFSLQTSKFYSGLFIFFIVLNLLFVLSNFIKI